MQNCVRVICRRIKSLNYSGINNFNRYIHSFKYDVLKNKLYSVSPNSYLTKCNFSNNASVTLELKQRNKVSNLKDLKQYISEEKQFYLKLLINILDSIEFENISNEDASLLLECCGSSVADSPRQIRNDVCQNIYKQLLKYKKVNSNIYHTYIKVCTENDVTLNCNEFLSSLKFVPNSTTYKLLLENVCEKGNIEQAYKLLEIMKDKALAADEEIFNKLVLGHTIQSGLKAGESVITTMRTAQVPETVNTKFAILKGVAKRNSFDDFENALSKYSIDLTEEQLLELLEILALNGNISWLPRINNLYSNLVITRDFSKALEKVCIHLVYMDKSESAMTIYEKFVEPAPNKSYGFFILKEMLHYNVDIERTVSLARHLCDENLNNIALENLTEIALRHNYTEASWKLLENLSELRIHFFWPLLLNANKKQGETGVFAVLSKIVSMNVKIDFETLQFYVLPFCDAEKFKFLIRKLQDIGLTTKEVLSPMIIVLLENNNVQQAADLCTTYNVQIFGEKLLTLLSTSWKATKDTEGIIFLLQRYCESNLTEKDSVGDFLAKTLNICKTDEDFTQYLELIKLIREKRLRINSISAETLHNICVAGCQTTNIADKIRDQIDNLLDFGLRYEPAYIPHPRNMNVDELECHLLELQEKGMETRGVLRKLIQLHSNLGNVLRVEELRQQFLSTGYEESIGMKSSLMHSYIKGGQLEAALNIYKEIKNTNPSFKIDDFKMIDLTTLLINEDRFTEAMNILRTEVESGKVRGGPSLEKNCWKLLASFKNGDEQLQMFNFLTENGYSKPTNVLLGPLVRLHLNRGDLQKAAHVYTNFAEKYKCTPLQLELICAILKSEDEMLLQSVLKVTEIIHGGISTQTHLIAALAENGQEKLLKKVLADNKFSITKALQKRCERWVQERKMEALQTLANACQRLPEVLDINFVYSCIMQVYSLNNDCKGALEFYEHVLEKDIINKELEVRLNKLLKRCNFQKDYLIS